MPIQSFVTDVARAVAFLSRLPVPARFFEGDDGRLSRTVRAFPAAGAVIALPTALLLALLLLLGGAPLLAALMALLLSTLIAGGLHEDGLADAADGLGGGRDRERALAIMKDSRTGSYGVLALIFSLGLRAAALSSLAVALGPFGTGLALIAAASLSRATMLLHWRALPPARTDGVAAGVGLPEPFAVRLALGSAVLLAILPMLIAGVSPAALFMAIALGFLVEKPFTRLCRRRIGGHTGDTIGATQQLSEIAFLTTLALAV